MPEPEATTGRKVHIKTWGCQMNAYDSDRLRDLLTAQGMEWTPTPADADLVLLNTCAIREKPQEKVFSELGRLKEMQKRRPHLKIGVGGCVGAQEGDSILARAPQVDFVFGPQTLHRVPALLEKVERENISLTDVTFPAIEKFDALPAPQAQSASAYLSIMEGCDKYCTFCIVPYTRGAEVSRPSGDILREAAHYAAQGVCEIVLLGQNVNAWCGRGEDFGWLLRRVAEIPGIVRVRYTTAHPADMTDDVIAAHAEVPALGSHVHLPVQSGSDKILAMMKRLYTRQMFLDTVASLREARPDMSISSDFIVGFPGEDARDFADTMRLVDEVAFSTSYSFVFSPRPGTPAERLPNRLEPAVATARLQQLQAQLARSATARRQTLIGTTVDCLVTGYAARQPGQMVARTDSQHLVHMDSLEPTKLGHLVPIHIVADTGHCLRGTFAS